MPAQPTGTVTMLFSDIEGSTRLLEVLGTERYAVVLARHRDLMRSAFERHSGYEVDSEGDAFFVAFGSATEALRAAGEAQRSLAAEPWPEEGAIRVRMGVHSGEPLASPPKYVGMDVHRAARIMAAGHGGQVLVSETTAALVEPDADLSLVDLGEHPLKDMTQPPRLYQLAGEGLESDFPALKTLGSRPNNLPAQPTALVGRERELEELQVLVREARLVSLVGPGGTGKTRLALQLGAELLEHFPSGVFFVPLAAIRDPGLVVPAIAQALKLREQPGEELAGTLAEHLRAKELLLVLDNLEQVLEAARAIADLLAAAPGLRVLATSREPLRLSGEQQYSVEPLADAEAVELFLERARAVKPDLAADEVLVAELCRRLDNLPLAIELAAARVKLLPLPALLERLDERLKLLTGGARDLDERQRTLRATVDWSHELLSVDEQALFRRLAVFAGSFELESAEEVCGAELDTLESLLTKSLVRRWDSGRLGLLETIREYAQERLEDSREAEPLRRRHAEHFLALAAETERKVRGHEQSACVDRLERDHDNLRAALEFARERGETELLLRLVGSVYPFWDFAGHLTEGLEWVRAALGMDGDGSPEARAKVLLGAGVLRWSIGTHREAISYLEQALVLFRGCGDSGSTAYTLSELAWSSLLLGDEERTRVFAREAAELARAAGERWTEAYAVHASAVVSSDSEEARALLRASQAVYAELGDAALAAGASAALGWVSLLEEDYERAGAEFEEALSGSHFGPNPNALNNLGLAELLNGRPQSAERRFRESIAEAGRAGARRVAAEALLALAGIAALRGELARSASLHGASLALFEAIDAPPSEIDTPRGAPDPTSA